MRAGIAREFRARYPEMYQEYRRRCHSGELTPGSVYLEKHTQPWILNLATQADTGGAQVAHIRAGLQWIVDNYEEAGITSIAMPRIASGLGGLSWTGVSQILDELLGPLDPTLHLQPRITTDGLRTQ